MLVMLTKSSSKAFALLFGNGFFLHKIDAGSPESRPEQPLMLCYDGHRQFIILVIKWIQLLN